MRIIRCTYFVVMLGVVALLTSCTTIATISGPVDHPKKLGQVRGIFYYLPQGLIRIKGDYADPEKPDGDFVIAVSYSYAADPRYRYYLEPGTNPFYDDEFKIHTNEKGLLQTVNSIAEDKTADILGDIASIAGSAIKFGAGFPPKARNLAADAKDRLRRQPFDYTFALNEVDEIKRELVTKGFDLKIPKEKTQGANASAFHFPYETTASTKNQRAAATREVASGIVFRPVGAYAVIITDAPFAAQFGEGPIIRHRTNVLIPESDKKLLLTLGRTPFIKRTDNLVFTDGVLTQVEGTRPSAVVGFLQIPKKILTAIVPLPLEIRQTQIDNIEAQRKLETLRAPEPSPAPASAPTSTAASRTLPTPPDLPETLTQIPVVPDE